MARRVQILHPEPLILMAQLDAVIPIIRNLHPVHRRPVDRPHIRRLLAVPVAERRPPVCVSDVGEGGPGVRVEGGEEGEGVVEDDSVAVLWVREGGEGGSEGVVGGGDGGAEGGLLGWGCDAEEVGPEGREVFGVEVGDEDVGSSGVEEGGD